MKSLLLFRLSAVLLSVVISAGIASAQPATTNALEWRQIPIKNTKVHLIAYWMDPAHNPKPEEYKIGMEEMNRYATVKFQESLPQIPVYTSKNSALSKPSNSTLFADNANNVLWVRSTPNDFDQIEKIVEFLDRKIRVIDFDVKLVELTLDDTSNIKNNPMLNMLFSPTKFRGLVPLSEKIESTLNDLIKVGDAKIVKATQMTIPNNLTDRYSTATSTPVTVDIKQADGETQILTTQSDKENPLFMEKRFSLVLTPTINNDDTITVFINASSNAELTHKTSANDDRLWVKNLDNQKAQTTVFTAKNGHSLLFTNFNSTMLGLNNENHPIVLWIKAEIQK